MSYLFLELSKPNQLGFSILSFISTQIITTKQIPNTIDSIGLALVLFSNLNLK